MNYYQTSAALFIHQPNDVKHSIVNETTSHMDIIPTILGILKKSHIKHDTVEWLTGQNILTSSYQGRAVLVKQISWVKSSKHMKAFGKNIFPDKIDNIAEALPNIYNKKIPFYTNKVVFNGWSINEKDHLWSLGKESKIIISKVPKDEKLKGILSLYISTLGKQEIKLTINDTYVGSQIINANGIKIKFKFEPNILHSDKVNILKFEFPNAHKPDNRDQRMLAMSLMEFIVE